jgi:O-antigen ligase
MDRSAFLGFGIAAGLMFVLGVGRSRVYFSALAAGLVVLVLLSAQGELPVPGGARLHNFWLSVSSGADIENDPDGQVRLQRWRATAAVWLTSPVLGVGFGAPILPDGTGENLRGEKKDAAQRGALGAFNVGMPHNSFLMALARTGIIGCGLICFAWLGGIFRIVKLAIRHTVDADQMACAAVLAAMIATAALNLFFERPMLSAPFWVMLAASYQLSKSGLQQLPMRSRASTGRPARPQNPQRIGHSDIPKDAVGGSQARWK